MRPPLVVVADMDAEDVLELATSEDQQPVEALPPDAANPALDVSVRVRSADRRPDCLHPLAVEDGIEGAAELRVTIVELPIQMNTSTYSRRSRTVSTVRKSQASVVDALSGWLSGPPLD